jgi:class 3 adenylate cyclase
MDMGTLEFKKIPKSIRDWFGLDRGPIVLVFTDIVGSTDLAIRMGDRDWVSRLIQHFKKARIYIERHEGCEVKLIGDSCMVAFRTADAALDFAIDFAGDTGDPEITIRAGIHVGDVRVIENDLYGVMVNYTSRVQHAMVGQGVALSTEAKQRIEHEHGASVRRRFDIIPVNHDPLKGFPTLSYQLLLLLQDFQVCGQIKKLTRFFKAFKAKIVGCVKHY